MTVVKAKRDDLKDILGRIRDQLKLCQEEIGLGSRWGSAPAPGQAVPSRSAGVGVDPTLLAEVASLPGDDEDESVASFFTRHLGRALAERLAFAMVNGLWAGDPHRLSMRACFPELHALVRRHRSLLLGLWRARAAPPPALPAAASTALAATTGTTGTTATTETTTAMATTTTSPAPTGTLALRGGLWAIGAAAAAQLPVRTGAIVLGKYLALLGLYTLVLVGTLPLVVLLCQLGDPPLLAIARGYLGALALGAALLSIAGFFSTLHADAISAFVSAAFTAFVLLALGDARVMAILDGVLPGSGLGSLLGERVALLGAYRELFYAPSFD